MTIQEPRSAFGPESLTRFTRILEEVMVDLIGDGVPAVEVRSIETRTNEPYAAQLRSLVVDRYPDQAASA